MAYPYSVRWLLLDASQCPAPAPAAQVLIVAPKRHLRHAVDRNRIKRLTRECYRLNKHPLVDFLAANNLTLLLSFSYIHNGLMSFGTLCPKMQKLLATLEGDLRRTHQALPDNHYPIPNTQ